MPFKSEAQRKYFYAHPEKFPPEMVKRWEEETKGQKLPKRADLIRVQLFLKERMKDHGRN